MKNTICACAVFFTLSASALVSAAELKVIGKILPATCEVTFSGAENGVIDYANIDLSGYSGTGQLELGIKDAAFAVNCSGDVTIALRIQDERTDSVEGGSGFGLGRVDSINIGYYRMALRSVTVNGATAQLLSGADGVAWSTSTGEVAPNSYMSWGVASPAAARNIVGQVEIDGFISNPRALPIGTESADLDGLSTFEVFYL